MEGLEISEVAFSNIDLGDRFDSEFFEKEDLRVEHILKTKNAIELRQFGDFVASAFYPAATHLYETGDTPFIRCVDCVNFPLITKEQDKSFEKIPLEFVENQSGVNTLNRNDIVITKVGTPSFPSMVYEHEMVALSRTVMGLKNIRDINKFYLLIFLRSKYGFSQLQRHRELTIQYQLTLERTKRTLVFVPSKSFQTTIEEIVHKFIAGINSAKQLYAQAENLLLETLGFTDFQPSQEPINVKSFSESFGNSGRLDAEYYQIKYEEIQSHIFTFKNGYTTVSSEFEISKDIIDRSKKAYNYTEISDVNVSDGSVEYNLIDTEDLPANGKLVLKERQIIISKVRPYRGAVGIIRNAPENYVGSGAFTVLSEVSSYKLEALQVLLRSKPYQELIMKFNVGSSYPVVKDEDILQLPIPVIDFDKQQEIADLVKESFKLKKQSEHLLEVAKSAVEMAIEQDEATAIAYIKETTFTA